MSSLSPQEQFEEFVKLLNKDTLEIVKLYIDNENDKQRKYLVIDKLLAFFIAITTLVVLYFGYISYLKFSETTHTKVETEYITKIIYKDKRLDMSKPIDAESQGFKKIFEQVRGKMLCVGYRNITNIEHYYTYCVENK